MIGRNQELSGFRDAGLFGAFGCLLAVVVEGSHNHVPSLEVLLEIETEPVFRERTGCDQQDHRYGMD
jgi:hypothetical protein